MAPLCQPPYWDLWAASARRSSSARRSQTTGPMKRWGQEERIDGRLLGWIVTAITSISVSVEAKASRMVWGKGMALREWPCIIAGLTALQKCVCQHFPVKEPQCGMVHENGKYFILFQSSCRHVHSNIIGMAWCHRALYLSSNVLQ